MTVFTQRNTVSDIESSLNVFGPRLYVVHFEFTATLPAFLACKVANLQNISMPFFVLIFARFFSCFAISFIPRMFVSRLEMYRRAPFWRIRSAFDSFHNSFAFFWVLPSKCNILTGVL